MLSIWKMKMKLENENIFCLFFVPLFYLFFKIMTDSEVIDRIKIDLDLLIKRFRTGTYGRVTPEQLNTLKAAYIHFNGKPINITCCADIALKFIIGKLKELGEPGY